MLKKQKVNAFRLIEQKPLKKWEKKLKNQNCETNYSTLNVLLHLHCFWAVSSVLSYSQKLKQNKTENKSEPQSSYLPFRHVVLQPANFNFLITNEVTI